MRWAGRSHSGSSIPRRARRIETTASAPLTMNQIIPGSVTGMEVPGTTE